MKYQNAGRKTMNKNAPHKYWLLVLTLLTGLGLLAGSLLVSSDSFAAASEVTGTVTFTLALRR